DGVKIPFAKANYEGADIDVIRGKLEQFREDNIYETFDYYINKFKTANRKRYEFLVSDATDYIREQAQNYTLNEMFVSFSGGKDSTVVSDLVMRALGTEKILHLYGDTSLEFPESHYYVERFKKEHKGTLLITAKNKDKDFYELCEKLGPPSRVMRWCCTIFKTGAIQRKITSLFKNNHKVLTFYGIRRNESTSRSKYEKESDSPKITKQRTVSPIIDWLDYDIWLYLLTSGTDFNNAYRLGYTRVGCWCCPNNSTWSGFLSSIYMPEQYEKFHSFLIDFAKKIGKPDPEVYVDSGSWKARQGGNGMEYAQTSVLVFEPCALQENTINFELQRPISDELYEMFKPFGFLNKDLGNERLGEVYVCDRNGKFLLKLQGKKGTTSLKVSILDKTAGGCNNIKSVEDKVKCQITKYQMCMGCLACESICKLSAISIVADHNGLVSYKVMDDRCARCGHCINHFDGGCYMRKVMCIKRG
ncbi:MAG: phosphoadenosine phosphosulfate reductase family protein, partial [Lachnospiraceae bacterium]|nr:phosphoadenosine phosphosulfate reductase family protein [Lachnospiraceae bacterium]